jgi:hypothetical protein
MLHKSVVQVEREGESLTVIELLQQSSVHYGGTCDLKIIKELENHEGT